VLTRARAVGGGVRRRLPHLPYGTQGVGGSPGIPPSRLHGPWRPRPEARGDGRGGMCSGARGQGGRRPHRGRQKFRTQAEAKMAVFDYIEGFYNPAGVTPPSARSRRSNFERRHAA